MDFCMLLLLGLSVLTCVSPLGQRVFQLENSELGVLSSSMILIPPSGKQGNPIAAILLPGANIRSDSYKELLNRVQITSKQPIWAAAAGFEADLALGNNRIAKSISNVHELMIKKGMPEDTPLFLVGHSLGARAIQEYAMGSQTGRKGYLNIKGTIFLGASLSRKFNGTVYPVPWITISGELDGLQRVTRIAQGFYHYVKYPKYSGPECRSSVVVVKGMNHMQYSNGKIPLVPSRLDLKPEITDEKAREITASLISAFIECNSIGYENSRESSEFLKENIKETESFLAPIIDALVVEGSYFLKKPCNSDNPSPHCPYYPAWPLQETPRPLSNDTDCFCEIPWTKMAIKHMMKLEDERFKIHHVDAIHDVRDTKPFHHAHIWNNCTLGPFPCTLNVTTVSELVYDNFENLDTGFTHATAREIRVKMKSRQLYWRNTKDPNASFNVDDDPMICAGMNRAAFEWALAISEKSTRDRFLKNGMQLKFLPDKHFLIPIGPLWINTKLKFSTITEKGVQYLGVQSVSMKTEIDSWINKLHPDSGGQHYCKVLSPARAIEWIYTDGLRHKLGIAK